MLDVVIDMDYGKGLVDCVLAGFPVSVEGSLEEPPALLRILVQRFLNTHAYE